MNAGHILQTHVMLNVPGKRDQVELGSVYTVPRIGEKISIELGTFVVTGVNYVEDYKTPKTALWVSLDLEPVPTPKRPKRKK